MVHENLVLSTKLIMKIGHCTADISSISPSSEQRGEGSGQKGAAADPDISKLAVLWPIDWLSCCKCRSLYIKA